MSPQIDMGELRAGRLCADSDLQAGEEAERYERGPGSQSKIPKTAYKRIWQEVL